MTIERLCVAETCLEPHDIEMIDGEYALVHFPPEPEPEVIPPPEPVHDRDGVRFYHGDSAHILPLIDEKVDLVVTSPPYDDMRGYGGEVECRPAVAAQIVNSLREGGVICWHVNDQVIEGGYSGSSFRQCLHFMDEHGLLLHDRIVVDKIANGYLNRKRWVQIIEFVFVLTKGKITTFNPIDDKPNISAGSTTRNRAGGRYHDGSMRRFVTAETVVTPEFGRRRAIWEVKPMVGRVETDHPAPMPFTLARDLVRAYSNEGDLVLDPFSGSGTTARAAQIQGRRAIGVEIHRPYIDDGVSRRFSQIPLLGGMDDEPDIR